MRNMTVSKYLIVTLLLLTPMVGRADLVLPSIEEIYPISVSYKDIKAAIVKGDLKAATQLAKDLAYQTLRQQLNDQKKIAVLATALGKELAKILNDTSKTDQQKGEEIIRLVENSLGGYQSTPSGTLNLTFKHSIEYGATRLTWDRKIVVDECRGAQWVTRCSDPYDSRSCASWLETWTTYVTRVPSYSIYRLVDGQAKLLTTFQGYNEAKTNKVELSLDPWKDVLSVFNYARSNSSPDIDASQAVTYDFHSDYRNKGHTLAYKVVADNPKGSGCKSGEHYEATASVDSNGDGKADFLPEQEYQKYFAKYYGWLTPVLAITLE